MKIEGLESSGEIEKTAKNILIASKAWGKFPTPIDKITAYTELQIENGIDLSKIEPGFFTAKIEAAKRALAKTLGMLDRRKKIIYLDHTQIEPRKNFITLHEVGHKVCSWQNAPGFVDDGGQFEQDPDVRDGGAVLPPRYPVGALQAEQAGDLAGAFHMHAERAGMLFYFLEAWCDIILTTNAD